MARENHPNPGDRTSLRAAWIGAAGAVIAALIAFLFTFFIPQKSTPPDTATEVILFNEGVGINVNTDPLTYGLPSKEPLAVAASKNTVSITATLPLLLAHIADNTSGAPLLGACQGAIAKAPLMKIEAKEHDWVCVRTATGGTKAIWIKQQTSTGVQMLVVNLLS